MFLGLAEVDGKKHTDNPLRLVANATRQTSLANIRDIGYLYIIQTSASYRLGEASRSPVVEQNQNKHYKFRTAGTLMIWRINNE